MGLDPKAQFWKGHYCLYMEIDWKGEIGGRVLSPRHSCIWIVSGGEHEMSKTSTETSTETDAKVLLIPSGFKTRTVSSPPQSVDQMCCRTHSCRLSNPYSRCVFPRRDVLERASWRYQSPYKRLVCTHAFVPVNPSQLNTSAAPPRVCLRWLCAHRRDYVKPGSCGPLGGEIERAHEKYFTSRRRKGSGSTEM